MPGSDPGNIDHPLEGIRGSAVTDCLTRKDGLLTVSKSPESSNPYRSSGQSTMLRAVLRSARNPRVCAT